MIKRLFLQIFMRTQLLEAFIRNSFRACGRCRVGTFCFSLLYGKFFNRDQVISKIVPE